MFPSHELYFFSEVMCLHRSLYSSIHVYRLNFHKQFSYMCLWNDFTFSLYFFPFFFCSIVALCVSYFYRFSFFMSLFFCFSVCDQLFRLIYFGALHFCFRQLDHCFVFFFLFIIFFHAVLSFFSLFHFGIVFLYRKYLKMRNKYNIEVTASVNLFKVDVRSIIKH